MDADDAFTSVTWDRRDDAALHSGSGNGAGASSSRTLDEGGFTSAPGPATPGIDGLTRHALAPLARGTHEADGEQPAWQGFLRVQVCEPRKEHEGTKEMFCSYGIRAEVSACGDRWWERRRGAEMGEMARGRVRRAAGEWQAHSNERRMESCARSVNSCMGDDMPRIGGADAWMLLLA
jgi:hypothetical protein